jgi:methionine biosynthesis protein MetW
MSQRDDFNTLVQWVAPRSRVLDLGCGDGELLRLLTDKKQVHGYGVDNDDAAVLACIQNGVNAIQGDVEQILREFPDAAFDVVILSRTLQATLRTEALMNEIMRVGKAVIVSMPNFGHWQVRLQLALGGHMPVSEKMPYQWYDTPNIHFATIADFDAFCASRGYRVLGRVVLADGQPIHSLQNLRGDLLMLHLQKS